LENLRGGQGQLPPGIGGPVGPGGPPVPPEDRPGTYL